VLVALLLLRCGQPRVWRVTGLFLLLLLLLLLAYHMLRL
jgi:hypothetical protein